jgi:hypothetical protein
MSGTRQALILGAIPITIGIIYYASQQFSETMADLDPAGVTMLVALGLAIGFGMLVILRGARDL